MIRLGIYYDECMYNKLWIIKNSDILKLNVFVKKYKYNYMCFFCIN